MSFFKSIQTISKERVHAFSHSHIFKVFISVKQRLGLGELGFVVPLQRCAVFIPSCSCHSLMLCFIGTWCQGSEKGLFGCLDFPTARVGFAVSAGAARRAQALGVLRQCRRGEKGSWRALHVGGCSTPDFGAFLAGSWSLIDVRESRNFNSNGGLWYLFIYLWLSLVGMLFPWCLHMDPIKANAR